MSNTDDDHSITVKTQNETWKGKMGNKMMRKESKTDMIHQRIEERNHESVEWKKDSVPQILLYKLSSSFSVNCHIFSVMEVPFCLSCQSWN